ERAAAQAGGLRDRGPRHRAPWLSGLPRARRGGGGDLRNVRTVPAEEHRVVLSPRAPGSGRHLLRRGGPGPAPGRQSGAEAVLQATPLVLRRIMYPAELRYTKDHEWVRIEGERATIGITDYAQKQLGDVVFVELPEPGRQLKAHEVFGTVESVKAVSELFSPVGGEVVEVNAALVPSPEAINTDPYGKAWMINVRLPHP